MFLIRKVYSKLTKYILFIQNKQNFPLKVRSSDIFIYFIKLLLKFLSYLVVPSDFIRLISSLWSNEIDNALLILKARRIITKNLFLVNVFFLTTCFPQKANLILYINWFLLKIIPYCFCSLFYILASPETNQNFKILPILFKLLYHW